MDSNSEKKNTQRSRIPRLVRKSQTDQTLGKNQNNEACKSSAKINATAAGDYIKPFPKYQFVENPNSVNSSMNARLCQNTSQHHIFLKSKSVACNNELVEKPEGEESVPGDNELDDNSIDNLEKLKACITIRSLMSKAVLDSWRDVKMKVPQLAIRRQELANQLEESARKLKVYGYMVKCEERKNRSKEIQVRNCNQEIISLEENILGCSIEISLARAILINESFKTKGLNTENEGLRSKVRSAEAKTQEIVNEFNEQKKALETLERSLEEEALSAWVLSTCIQPELKSQNLEMQGLVTELEAKNSELRTKEEIQSNSVRSYQNLNRILEEELNSLGGENLTSERKNGGLQTILRQNLVAQIKLEENVEQLAICLKEQSVRRTVLLNDLTEYEGKTEQDLADLVKLKHDLESRNAESKVHRRNKILSQINWTNLFKFFIGYDHHLI